MCLLKLCLASIDWFFRAGHESVAHPMVGIAEQIAEAPASQSEAI
jgi:hypothetical protein